MVLLAFVSIKIDQTTICNKTGFQADAAKKAIGEPWGRFIIVVGETCV